MTMIIQIGDMLMVNNRMMVVCNITADAVIQYMHCDGFGIPLGSYTYAKPARMVARHSVKLNGTSAFTVAELRMAYRMMAGGDSVTGDSVQSPFGSSPSVVDDDRCYVDSVRRGWQYEEEYSTVHARHLTTHMNTFKN